jgi:hypothetical protein
LQGKYTLEAYVPKRLGTWYVKGGVQYYHLVNDALLAAQIVGPGIVPPAPQLAYAGTGVVLGFPQAKRDIGVFNVGVGFSY